MICGNRCPLCIRRSSGAVMCRMSDQRDLFNRIVCPFHNEDVEIWAFTKKYGRI